MDKLSPLLQLNLFIHMSLDYSNKSDFFPYLNKKGYVIKAIEQKVPVNSQNVRELLKNKVPVNQFVTPEMILIHRTNGNLLLIECKVKSFNVDFEHSASRQALGYLSLSPQELSEFLGLGMNRRAKANLMYATDKEHIPQLQATLNSLQHQTKVILGNALPYEVIGIEINDKGCFIVEVSSGRENKTRIINNSSLKDGAMIYIVPFEPNSQIDEYGQKVLERQVRNSLRVFIGRHIGPKEYSFKSSDICEDINPVWISLPSTFRNKVKRMVHYYILAVIKELNNIGLCIVESNQAYTIPSAKSTMVRKVRKFLISEKFLVVGEDIFRDIEQLTIDDFLESVDEDKVL